MSRHPLTCNLLYQEEASETTDENTRIDWVYHLLYASWMSSFGNCVMIGGLDLDGQQPPMNLDKQLQQLQPWIYRVVQFPSSLDPALHQDPHLHWSLICKLLRLEFDGLGSLYAYEPKQQATKLTTN